MRSSRPFELEAVGANVLGARSDWRVQLIGYTPSLKEILWQTSG